MVEEGALAKEESFYCCLLRHLRAGFVGSSHYTALSLKKKDIFINRLNNSFSQKCHQATIVSEGSVCALWRFHVAVKGWIR